MKEKMKGFILGLCVALVLTTAVTAFAVGIDVHIGGIRVYWDGVEKTLRDANGEKVEPMIYNGTTYVPLRAMGQLLGKKVEWDQATTSVYVGGKPVQSTLHLEDLERSKIDSYDVGIRTGADATFELKDEKIQCDNLLQGSRYDDNIYILNGKYARLVGKAVAPYTSVGSKATNTLTFYSVENDGTEHEIISYELQQAQNPIDVEVNLLGVENLRIKWGEGISVALYNVDLLAY
ncbi:MAG: hypothetical protein IJN25_03760 [Clostridia bacterium]|nr:copper amine oxidase N-terminal domain-containing protein [Oscillospiraceae bacterium]MBQ7032759.1 hypothetical protein [Clostridia bacterium]